MGICLDTERDQNGSQEFESKGRGAWFSDEGGMFRYANASTPPEGQFPMQNAGPVRFEPPSVPVIFVLGGPGSGKVTHCDNLTQEKRGIVHINMTDLLQQYTIGNDMKDFSQLSSRTVTEVLMLEMKMSPAAKTYLVSGYPRNMRDVVEYSDKIQTVNGVIVVAWRQRVLERQIDYGAKLGHVVLSLARMELANFFKNVMPVADYFDQRGMVIAVNGERNPAEVYNDFRAAVLRILGPNSTGGAQAAMGARTTTTTVSVYNPPNSSKGQTRIRTGTNHPPVVWVVGGPGSNKAQLCQKVAKQVPGWAHVSVGRLLRTAAEGQHPLLTAEEDIAQLRQAIAAGEMAPSEMVERMIDDQMATNITASGLLLDGYPRDIPQVEVFEQKFEQQPTLLLLDCSKLQLGRGRLDDSIAAFRRRLELFREWTLPMLKSLDDQNRLVIVDGDTDSPQVQDEFCQKLLQEMERLSTEEEDGQEHNEQLPNGVLKNEDTTIHDLEIEGDDHNQQPSSTINKTISDRQKKAKATNPQPHAKHLSNGYGPPTGISDISRTFAAYNKASVPNGYGPNREAPQQHSNEHYPMDSNM